MGELVNDDMIYPIMLEMAACLKAEYEDQMSEPALVAGEFIPVDFGDECSKVSGFVRLVTSYPSEGNFPGPEATAQPCGATLAFQLFVGVMRCPPEMDSEGWIDPKEYNQWTASQLADMAAIRRAISCCLASKFEDTLYAVIEWTPIEISGDAGGGQWQVVIRELGA
jgi:hypothetical protein